MDISRSSMRDVDSQALVVLSTVSTVYQMLHVIEPNLHSPSIMTSILDIRTQNRAVK